MLTILIDPERLGGAQRYQQEIPALLDWVRSSHSDNNLTLSGEWEQRNHQQRSTHGIFIDDVSWQQLSNLQSVPENLK
ncbi:hypothetical protein [Yersinia sp. 2466 StPb PI]|uniref:hypothetical protein n=1 Tax=Yersinia sp. 2466 StPb PI TaxID=3061648 RepID=UPI00355AE6F0